MTGIIITGASHTGKTLLAQKLLEKHHYPYLSTDHLKMGLIRNGNTTLTPLSSSTDLTAYLWPIVREIIKTAIENKQHLIIEGCYVPFDWAKDFNEEYLQSIKYYCLIMSEDYIKKHFSDIINHANDIEKRLCDDCTMEDLLHDNAENLSLAQKHGVNYILIDDKYKKNFLPFCKGRVFYIFASFFSISAISLRTHSGAGPPLTVLLLTHSSRSIAL